MLSERAVIGMTAGSAAVPIAQFCARCQSYCHASLGIQNGGYLCLGADQRELRSVSRFLARRRAERRIGAPKSSVGHARDGAQISRLRRGLWRVTRAGFEASRGGVTPPLLAQ